MTNAATDLHTKQPWPEGVTARIVTRMGLILNDPTATVDVGTRAGRRPLPDTYYARCRPCGWNKQQADDLNKVLDRAQDHADRCSALPHPNP